MNTADLAKALHAQLISLKRERLPHWVIYDHPSDHPDKFVARLWYSLPEPEPLPTGLMVPNVEVLRDLFSRYGFVKFDRQDGDDPSILETWLM